MSEAAVAGDRSTEPIADHRRNNIDTLRLLAALAVLFAHAFVLAEPGARDPVTANLQEILPLQRGLSGQAVALFFVVSGYLVTASFARRGQFGSYAASRLLRIMPALWAALILTVLVATVITTLPAGEFLTQRTTSGYLLHNASLLDLRYELAGVFSANPSKEVNVSLWTLPLEFGMYVVVAAVGLIGLLRLRRPLARLQPRHPPSQPRGARRPLLRDLPLCGARHPALAVRDRAVLTLAPGARGPPP
jgi:peptidoglycan/LPS O-acetylase OafA/YrhL